MEDMEAALTSLSANHLDDQSLRTDAGLLPDLDAVEKFRSKLKYFFMSPCEKFKARGTKPWKLVLQVLKIAIITAQLVSFGLSNQMVVTFKDGNLMAFKHLFLKGYTDSTADTYAVYTQDEMYDRIYFVINQYVHLPNLTVGNQAYVKSEGIYAPLSLCQEFYRKGNILPGNETFDIDTQTETDCVQVYPMRQTDEAAEEGNHLNFTLHFKRLLSVTISFTLKAINLQTVRHHELPDCYDFMVMITFDNTAHSGRININLENDVDINECKDWNVTGESNRNFSPALLFDSIVIVTCLASQALCTRSFIKGRQLMFEYITFFQSSYGKNVPWSDRMEFVNGWYILIIISDTLTIVGTILKIAIQTKNLTSYDICSILLGTATMMVWVGVIRYLSFFKKYNILILTLRAALPNVIRFCCCASMIYLGYCFCGWIVLGPYHEKFRTLNTVSECLFSLINGDDMFPTFNKIQQKSYFVWLFSRLYLYSFISLFTFMVLSLFITLITDTYETIKQCQKDGHPKSDLHAFMAECKYVPNSRRCHAEEVPAPCLSCFYSWKRINDINRGLNKRLGCKRI